MDIEQDLKEKLKQAREQSIIDMEGEAEKEEVIEEVIEDEVVEVVKQTFVVIYHVRFLGKGEFRQETIIAESLADAEDKASGRCYREEKGGSARDWCYHIVT